MNSTTKTKPTAKSPAQQRRDDMLLVIAIKHLDLMSLDFDAPMMAQCPIPALKAALEAAYEAGAQAAIAATSGRR